MRNRNKRVLTTYPLKDVMAYAVMADTINNGEYIKQTVHKMEEFVESGTDPKYVVESYSNKEIINVAMGTDFLFNKADGSEQFEGKTPSDSEVKLAEEILTYYSGLMFKAIGGKINDFEQNVLSIVKKGELTPRDFGIVANRRIKVARDAINISLQFRNTQFLYSVKLSGSFLTFFKISGRNIFIKIFWCLDIILENVVS